MLICVRFGSRDDIVKKFNKLVQERNVDDDVEKFEELKSLMSVLNLSLLESYYVSSFISGLKDDINPMLKILKPLNVLIAFEWVK